MAAYATSDGRYRVERIMLTNVPVVADRSEKLRQNSPAHGDGEYYLITQGGFLVAYATRAERSRYLGPNEEGE